MDAGGRVTQEAKTEGPGERANHRLQGNCSHLI